MTQNNHSVASGKKRKIRKNVTELEDDSYLEPEEIARFFDVITRKRDIAIFRITYHHGLRASEVGALKYEDYSERERTLYIYRGKGSICRIHRLIDVEMHALRMYIKGERGTKPGPMFPSRKWKSTGKGIGRDRLDELMKKYCKLAKIHPSKAHMHVLKHSCGTHLAERGNSVDSIQDWLGHRNVQNTAKYMHFSRRRREELMIKNRDWK